MPFSPSERNRLLAAPRIGPGVVARLEQLGFDSMAQVRAAGAAAVTDLVCTELGGPAWANRRRALERAIAGAVLPAPGRS